MSDQILPAHERRRLLSLVTGEPLAETYEGMLLTDRQRRRYDTYLQRRLDGEPLQYLEGTVEFGPLTVAVDRRALIPRPETEYLWELVVGEVGSGSPSVVVDLCTGSGVLALALKHSFPDAWVVGTDLSTEAIRLAEENGHRTGLDVTWWEGDLFDALPAHFASRVDLLVANPPYVADGAYLPMEVRDHEPVTALYAGPDGTEVLARIASGAGDWLAPGGVVACEIGADQGRAAADLFSRYGARVVPDLTGRDRFVIGRHR
jgi:release factor glutamine methyltransferase